VRKDHEMREREKRNESHKESEENKGTAAGGRRKKEYFIDIFRGWCKSCGICAAFCPRECIRMNEEGSPEVVNADSCSGCGWCEVHCPDFAISVRSRENHQVKEDED
jgi:2-oxoglutarate ferredoxin oxidoreductase subunit delta